MKNENLLGIVIVNYKSYQETIKYIKDELSKVELPKRIVVVTNEAVEQEVCFMASELNAFNVRDSSPIDLDYQIFLLNANQNLGFAKGNNLGVEFLVENFNPEYFLFTNSDIVLISENIIEKLISKIIKTKNIGVIGPKVISFRNGKEADGSPNTQKISAVRFLHRNLLYPLHRIIIFVKQNMKPNNEIEEELVYKPEGEQYWISGCFMLAKSSCFCAAGMFDSNTFLYAEEMILSERIKKIGYRMYYYPEVSIFHKENVTTSKFYDNIQRSKLVFRSMSYYYTTYIVPKKIWKPIFRFTSFVIHNIYYQFISKTK